jgi:hypothetical protein
MNTENLSNSREKTRWLIWTVVVLVLFFCGRSLLHLKHMEWFMLAFSLGSGGLVLAFRSLRGRE